ncbi:rRNA maturation RNase YbeY [Radiobacillus kanasensis]|uniref:rRNA maturation RNase YbeY n=1 Tax=Radiobacillus kanasensis TaxID=2844358 RepID=UPI001E5A9E25|nr:rRNA maturation RNase YbeY [Radiobacillus kanasensis]UFT97814.1 rRNA maturation RNase YbeY [Radiobacillus kanasensis]
MQIDFQDATDQVKPEHFDLVEKLLEQAAELEQVSDEAELSVSFVDNDEIQTINREYRNIDKPTDVISFAMQESMEDEPEIVGDDVPLLLGDIIISVDKAEEQATEYNHSFERELGFLAVHGFLHLLGYDHMNEDDEKKMFGRQEEILHAFGLSRE